MRENKIGGKNYKEKRGCMRKKNIESSRKNDRERSIIEKKQKKQADRDTKRAAKNHDFKVLLMKGTKQRHGR